MEKYSLLRGDAKPYCDRTSSSASHEDLTDASPVPSERRKPFYRRCSDLNQANVLFFTLNVILIVGILSWTINQSKHTHGFRYTPARGALEYEAHSFDVEPTYLEDGTINPNHNNRFVGEPNPELYVAWNELLQYQNIRLSYDELGERRDEPGTIALPDGGYFATLTVYHSLHCLKRLHRLMYIEHYYGNLTAPELYRLRGHASHCIDVLRQTIQCQPDVTVIPLNWGIRQAIPLGSDTGRHECAKWEKLDDWMKERSFNPMEPGYLDHPSLGPAFPDGEGDAVGIIVDHAMHDD